MALFKRQQTLERELNRSGAYVDKSIHETISQLIMDNQLKRADELQREFKVPDKMFVAIVNNYFIFFVADWW